MSAAGHHVPSLVVPIREIVIDTLTSLRSRTTRDELTDAKDVEFVAKFVISAFRVLAAHVRLKQRLITCERRRAQSTTFFLICIIDNF